MYKWNLIERDFIIKLFDKIGYLYFPPDIPIKQKKDDPCIKIRRSNALCMYDGPEGKKGVGPWD